MAARHWFQPLFQRNLWFFLRFFDSTMIHRDLINILLEFLAPVNFEFALFYFCSPMNHTFYDSLWLLMKSSKMFLLQISSTTLFIYFPFLNKFFSFEQTVKSVHQICSIAFSIFRSRNNKQFFCFIFSKGCSFNTGICSKFQQWPKS